MAERDAELDLLMLQWGHSNQQLDSAVETARTAVSTAKSLEDGGNYVYEACGIRSWVHGVE